MKNKFICKKLFEKKSILASNFYENIFFPYLSNFNAKKNKLYFDYLNILKKLKASVSMEQKTKNSQKKPFQLSFHKLPSKSFFILKMIIFFNLFQKAPSKDNSQINKELKSINTLVNLQATKEIISNPNSFQNVLLRKTRKFKPLHIMIKFFYFIIKMLCCCFFIISKRKTREHTLAKIKTKLYTLPILSFFSRLILVIRAIKNLRNQTIFRKPDHLQDFDYYLIDDISYVRTLDHQNTVSENLVSSILKFFSSKMTKNMRRLIKICLKKLFHFWSNINLNEIRST